MSSLLSIITPCFNSVDTIRETMASVLSQTYRNYEYIIIDGGSTDGTLDIIREYAPHFQGRMRWISEPDRGIYDAVQKGFAMSKGDVLAWIGSDDIYMPNAFAYVKMIFEEHPQVQWLTGELCHIQEDGTFCNAEYTRNLKYRDFCLKKGFWVQQEATFWRRELWEKCSNAFGNYRYAGDYALWLNFARNTQLYTLPLLLAAFRLRSGQASQKHRREYMAEIDDICRKELASMSYMQRLELRIYSMLRGRRLLGRLARKMEKHWDKGVKNFYFNHDTRTIEMM